MTNMRSYYAKYYYNSDARNCRNYNSGTSNTVCHYVIRRSESCEALLSSSAPVSTELYSDSNWTNRFSVVSVPNLSDLNVIESNCSEVVSTYGGQYVDYQDGYVGFVLAVVVFGLAFGGLLWSIIRRHF